MEGWGSCWGGATAFAGVVEVRRGTLDEAETLAARWRPLARRVEEAMRLIDTESKGGSSEGVLVESSPARRSKEALVNVSDQRRS